VQAGDVVDRHPREVLLADRIDEDAHAVLLEDQIVRRRGFVEGHLVLETRASAADDAHPEAESDDLFLRHRRFDHFRGLFGQAHDRSRAGDGGALDGHRRLLAVRAR
jgi:hypothetical protein